MTQEPDNFMTDDFDEELSDSTVESGVQELWEHYRFVAEKGQTLLSRQVPRMPYRQDIAQPHSAGCRSRLHPRQRKARKVELPCQAVRRGFAGDGPPEI
jgi:hypothetical protein